MFDKAQVLRILKKPMTFFELAKALRVPKSENRNFSTFIRDLERQQQLFSTSKGLYFVPHFEEETQGILKINPSGFGFVDLIDKDKSFFIAPNSINTGMDGDVVKIKTFKDPVFKDKYQGLVIHILQRNRTTFVGEISELNGRKNIIPIDLKIKSKFDFEDSQKLAIGTLVKAEIFKFGKSSKCKVIKVLGNKEDISIDILAIIEDADVRTTFGDKTIQEAESISDIVKREELEGREDFRKRLIVTIDGDDTKDFDDAIEVYKDGENFVLGVHIADVTHYVKEDTPLDNEAKDRGTSIYLADRVIPMLPKKLSNGICSLNPNVDRLVLSAIMTINEEGKTIDYKLVAGVINSKQRLTYKEVNNYYGGAKTFENKDLEKMLDVADELSKAIRKYKVKEGYIDFEIEESKLIIDDKGNTIDIVARERGISEMMIEDFMVRANETVAAHGTSNKVPFIYRIHDKPSPERIEALQNVINVLEMGIKIPDQPSPKQFSIAVEEIKKSRFDDFIKVMMLRTMAKAVYSMDNIGHFGLASENYTHFTSPIRRYPDLIVHRMIREYFFKGNIGLKEHFATVLPKIATHSSNREQTALDLERKVADIKKAEFYEKFIGETFKGTINSVTKFGFFVEFPNKVDGLVHNSTLPGMWVQSNNGLILSNGKDKYTVGDKVSVVVVNVEKESGKIDLVLSQYHDEFKVMHKQK